MSESPRRRRAAAATADAARATQGDESITQRIYQSLLEAFEEDRRMITAQARNIATDPAAPMLPLAMDSALTRYRRIVQQALDAERVAVGATA